MKHVACVLAQIYVTNKEDPLVVGNFMFKLPAVIYSENLLHNHQYKFPKKYTVNMVLISACS